MERFPILIKLLYNYSDDPGMQKLRKNKDEVRLVAQKLLDSKRQELVDGTPRKDVMSLLGSSLLPPVSVWLLRTSLSPVKASDSQRQGRGLSDEEILSQVQ